MTAKIPIHYKKLYMIIVLVSLIGFLIGLSLYIQDVKKNKNKNKDPLQNIYYSISAAFFFILMVCLEIFLEIYFKFSLITSFAR